MAESKCTETNGKKIPSLLDLDLSGVVLQADKVQYDLDARIFVGNMPIWMNWYMLKVIFSKFGKVVFATVVKNHKTQVSKRFGFIQFARREEAQRVLKAPPNCLVVSGRYLYVAAAREKKDPQVKDLDRKDNQKKEPEVRLSMDHLNDDILICILSYLSFAERVKFERVSKRWQKCAKAACRQRRRETLRNESRFSSVPPDVFHKIVSRLSPNLISLDVSNVGPYLEYLHLKIIGNACPHLESLDISTSRVDDQDMEIIIESCKKLKCLRMVGCPYITEDMVQFAAAECKHLEHLDITGKKCVDGDFLKVLSPNMKELCLGNCIFLDGRHVRNLPKTCPFLEKLILKHCMVISHSSICSVLKRLKHLKEFDIGGVNYFVDGNGIPHNIQHVTHSFANPSILVSLEIFGTGLQDHDLQLICDRCPLLSKLDISCNKLTDTSVVRLRDLHHLKVLRVCHLCLITDESLMEVVLRGNLEEFRAQGCKSLSHNLFQKAAARCGRLTEMDICGVHSITYHTLTFFASSVSQWPERKLTIYVSKNRIRKDLLNNFWQPSGLSVVEKYRPLYISKLQWRHHSDAENRLLNDVNMDIKAALDQTGSQNFDLLNVKSGGLQPELVSKMSIMYAHLEDLNEAQRHHFYLNVEPPEHNHGFMVVDGDILEEFLGGVEDFLENDDPLAEEDFLENMS